ncbi:MAG: hypothetical protein J0M08_03535 [Bacteroidetes bacterium]|nr:hypothetical protein [Bacteroidota bacterium]
MDIRPDYQEKNNIRVINRKIIVFICCLLLSIFFWFLNALSKDYTTTITFPTKYIKYKQNNVLNNLPEKITVTLRARGYKLLKKNIFGLSDSATIDLRKNIGIADDKFYYSTNQNSDKIKLGTYTSNKISNITPDTIYLSLTEAVTKQVKVKPILSYQLESEYKLIDSITVLPNTIEISGPRDLINLIDYLETTPISFGNIKDSITQEAPLNLKKEWKGLLNLSVEKVTIKVRAEKFTEKTVQIPIELENTSDIKIKIFPTTATLKFLISQKKYETISASDFKVVANYSKSKSTGINKIKLEITKYPTSIQRLVVSPEKVEFIQKK